MSGSFITPTPADIKRWSCMFVTPSFSESISPRTVRTFPTVCHLLSERTAQPALACELHRVGITIPAAYGLLVHQRVAGLVEAGAVKQKPRTSGRHVQPSGHVVGDDDRANLVHRRFHPYVRAAGHQF